MPTEMENKDLTGGIVSWDTLVNTAITNNWIAPTTTTKNWTISAAPLEFKPKPEEIKKACEEELDRIDRHIDNLEEDIDFLNEKRHEMEDQHMILKSDMATTSTLITELFTKISQLESYTQYLQGQIDDLKYGDKNVSKSST